MFESQGRARAAEAALKRVQAEAADRDKQLRIMTDQNAELLRLLEQEEAQTARLSAANEVRTRVGVGLKLFLRTRTKRFFSYLDTGVDSHVLRATAAKTDLGAPILVVLLVRSSERLKNVLPLQGFLALHRGASKSPRQTYVI